MVAGRYGVLAVGRYSHGLAATGPHDGDLTRSVFGGVPFLAALDPGVFAGCAGIVGGGGLVTAMVSSQ